MLGQECGSGAEQLAPEVLLAPLVEVRRVDATGSAYDEEASERPSEYADRTVALCAGDDVLLAPEIAALEPDHPTRRFVSMLCVFSAEVDAGAAPDGVCGYSPAAAERYARRELMPDELFCPLAHRP
jgi:hypothetical protein